MSPSLKQIKSLMIALFISGALNILLLAFTFFFAFWERPPTPYYEHKPKFVETSSHGSGLSPTNARLLAYYKTLPYEQLIPKLSANKLVEDGFKERDLALAALTTFHDFDLERALGTHNMPNQNRILLFNEGKEKVVAYPSLSDEQFSILNTFIKTEKWPFRSQGLFHLMKMERYRDDSTLQDAFALTSEFLAVESLFKKVDVAREELFKIIREGDWRALSAFYERQKRANDLSDENRTRFLLAWIKMGSKTSVRVLLKTDFQFAAKRLSDATILSILRLIDKSDPFALRFLNAMRVSPRGDSVRMLAESKHLELTGKPIEPLVSRSKSLPEPIQKVIPFTSQKQIIKPIASATPLKKGHMIYIVQERDSLWKISKRFKVSIEKIRSYNELKNDFLKPGIPLKIPKD